YAQTLRDFIWNDLCDWYIEMVKPTIRESRAQRHVLASCIDVSLRLLHPIMPFITERLFDALNAAFPTRVVDSIEIPESELLIQARWPHVDENLIDDALEENFGRTQMIIGMIREVRSLRNIPPREVVDVSVRLPEEYRAGLVHTDVIVETMAKVNTTAVGPAVEKPAGAAVIVRPIAEVYLHDQFDETEERERLSKRRDEVEAEVKKLRGRLSNENYVNKAPAKLVQQTRDQLAEREAELKKLEVELSSLEA
ncbi:MAG: class I tRNA ligase family protein, partial [Rhodospirillales bacterium]|nr:class I tRNA ligase family protein [Rhodospirillales bacterium]